MDEKKQLIIGITGIIGSGKSTVAKYYGSLGYDVIYSDEISKEIIKNNVLVQNKIKAVFGENSFLDDNLNSSYISEIVFNDINKLEKLNRILHPAVIDEISNLCEKFINEGKELIFVESALMFETGTFDGYDYVIAVDCPESIAIQRVMTRSGLTELEIKKRMKTQFDNSKKVSLADFSISNKKTEKELFEGAEFVLSIIQTLPPKEFNDEE